MSNNVDETMLIINVIDEYIKKNPDSEEVEKYYLTHGTFDGIVEYLNDLTKKMTGGHKNVYRNNNKKASP